MLTGKVRTFVEMINSTGNVLRFTTFGESHGPATGGVLDGCPPGITVDEKAIRAELARRKAGLTFFSSQRSEDDEVEFLSGLLKNKTTGAPIAFIIRNRDARPQDYKNLKAAFRPSHADFTWHKKYGLREISGGGRSSARVLLPCVVAGVIAKSILQSFHCALIAWVSGIGPYHSENTSDISAKAIESSPLRCPDTKLSAQIMTWLQEIQKKGDTAGGIITCRISGCPAGLGEPVFGKLHADLAHAMMGINSVKGFEYGTGFSAASMTGSEHNDMFTGTAGSVRTLTNHDGGIQGGISNGEDIVFRIAFKPVPSISMEQQTVDMRGKKIKLQITGRHDCCAVPRAVPIVEALSALVIADHYLMQKLNAQL